MATKFLTTNEIEKRLRTTKQTLWAKRKEGLFPAPIRFGKQSLYPETEVNLVVDALAIGASRDEMRQLVTEIIARRKDRNPFEALAMEGIYEDRMSGTQPAYF